MTSFATLEDLQAFWKPLDTEERARAQVLLNMVSNYLRQVAKNNSTDIDERISNDASGVFKDSVKMVVLQATKRAVTIPSDAPPADQWSMSATPYSETMKFTNPSGDLFFKNNELQLLGLASISGKSQIGILRGARGGETDELA